MRLLIAALAASVLAIPLAPAQTRCPDSDQGGRARNGSDEDAQQRDGWGRTAQSRTAHLQARRTLSEAYGDYELVDNWQSEHLTMPPEGHHWVRYGENYLLVTATDGLSSASSARLDEKERRPKYRMALFCMR